jgi:hypothetical protein
MSTISDVNYTEKYTSFHQLNTPHTILVMQSALFVETKVVTFSHVKSENKDIF